MEVEDADKMSKVKYEQFKKCFATHQSNFGLGYYHINFSRKKLDNGTIAEIAVDAEGCVAEVHYNTRQATKKSVDDCALHEVLHLLMGNFSHVAMQRFTNEEVLRNEEEKVVMTLERLMK